MEWEGKRRRGRNILRPYKGNERGRDVSCPYNGEGGLSVEGGLMSRLRSSNFETAYPVSMPTNVQVEFGFTDNVGDDSLAGFTLRQVFLKSVSPSLLVGKTLTRFRLRPSHR